MIVHDSRLLADERTTVSDVEASPAILVDRVLP